MKTKEGKIYWWLLAIAALFFIPFLGKIHLFDWDEINFAECAREMINSDNYFRPQINYLPFWEKPPLFIWLQVASMKAFGINEFAARLPNALIGLLTIFTVMRLGDRMSNMPKVGKYWALALLGSILPHLYYRSGIIDPLFNYFIFLGIVYYGKTFAKSKEIGDFRYPAWAYAAISGFLIGLGILTKGPVAYLIIGSVVMIEWMIRGFRNFKPVFFHLSIISIVALLTTLLWFGPDIIQNGTWFIETFVNYQIRLFSTPDSGHGGFVGYHIVVLLFGVFPASFLALRGLLFRKEIRRKNDTLIFNRLMSVTFWVVLVLFTIVKSKIVHYSSLAYFPLTYYAAIAIVKNSKAPKDISLSLKKVMLAVGILMGLLVAIVPYVGQHIQWLSPLFQNDQFAQANIKAQIPWSLWHGIAGVWLIAVLIGWFWADKNKKKYQYEVLFLGVAMFVWITLSLYVKKIEGYSQRAAIEFYQSKQEEDCYIVPWGYKSYAHLFYGKVKPHENKKAYDQDWLIHGDIDKPTYIICKINGKDSIKNLPDTKEVFNKNGFVVYMRSKK